MLAQYLEPLVAGGGVELLQCADVVALHVPVGDGGEVGGDGGGVFCQVGAEAARKTSGGVCVPVGFERGGEVGQEGVDGVGDDVVADGGGGLEPALERHAGDAAGGFDNGVCHISQC